MYALAQISFMKQIDAAFGVALRALGNLCGFGINYFGLKNVGYVKATTKASADNSTIMRNI